jgi:hypothetical protein
VRGFIEVLRLLKAFYGIVRRLERRYRGFMKRNFLLLVMKPALVMVLALFALGGCALLEPHLFIEGEFDRKADGFGNLPEDISSATICYSSSGTSPQQVLALAQGRCEIYGKNAKISRQDYTTCPLLTPTAAHFDCISP